MSVVTVKGTIELSGCLQEDNLVIRGAVLKSGVDATVQEEVIFFNSVLDNENKFIESLASLVAHKLPLGHEDIILEVEGEDIHDKYDVVIKQNRVYLRYYDLVPQELELYEI